VALQLKPDAIGTTGSDRVIIAGSNLVRMTLAEVARPDAEMIWTDFRHSASLGALHHAVLAAGGLDRMILAADGAHGEAVFSVMCAILTLLPSLQRRPTSRIELVCSSGKAVTSLEQFVDRIKPQLAKRGVVVTLEVLKQQADRTLV
jgi:hypothetical protein